MIYLAQLPDITPLRRSDVPIGRPDRSPHWIQLTHGVWAPASVANESRFGIDAITRARSYPIAYPKAIASHFAALALHRVQYWVNDQPSHFYGPRSVSNKTHDDWLIIRKRWRPEHPIQTCTPDPHLPNIQALLPNVALAGCLDLLEKDSPQVNVENWYVPYIEGFTSTEIRQIQLTDATRAASLHATYPTVGDIKGHCAKALYDWAVKNSSRGCQSPPETIMRLMIEQSIDQREWAYLTQVELQDWGKLVTTLDGLLIPHALVPQLSFYKSTTGVEHTIEFRSREWEQLQTRIIGFQYDGEHHWDRTRRNKDFEISAVLEHHGLKERRLTANDLRSFEALRPRVQRRVSALERVD